MNPRLRAQAKRLLAKLLPDSARLRYLSYLPKLETFRKARGKEHPVFESRYKMYDYLNESVIGKKPIAYLEFGVFKGASIKYWAGINSEPGSRFYGFDTFTGLPGTWDNFTANLDKKTFDVGGKFPVIDDPRVSFVPGLFQDSLPKFLKDYVGNLPLVIHIDSDLYSSALYVLTRANDIILPGTLVIFDEFTSVLHEFRALEDYCSSYMRKYDVVGATTQFGECCAQTAVVMK